MKLGFGDVKRSIHSHSFTTVAPKRRTWRTIPTSNIKKTLNSQNPTNGTSHLDGAATPWNFSNTSLLISPAWKSMLHESLRNFALARSPETALLSGRFEHPMYIFSV